GEEGQGQAGDGGELEVHPDVLDHLGGEPRRDAGGDEVGEGGVAADADEDGPGDEEGIDHDDPEGAEVAELLGRDREDEVGLLERNEPTLRRRSGEQPGPGPPAATDRDGDLVDLVADAERVALRVE